jgi:IS5 family transposase
MKKPSKSPRKQKTGEKKGKKHYKVRNWKEYNQALVDRGKIFFWITDDAIKNWESREKTGKRGKPRTFSNIAIETALTLQQVFHMPLRSCEGFIESILLKLGASVQTPDYSTLSIRGKSLSIKIRVRPITHEPLHIVTDSTGVKVYGEGEWKVRQHGWSKRRTWRKLHIGVDESTGDILLGEVTGNDTADCEMLVPLLDQLPKEQPIHQVSADGAYDKRVCYAVLKKHQVAHIAIPPQRNAKIWQHGNTRAEKLVRDENLRRIRKVGRKQWKIEADYHRRSLAETGMFRIKTIFGERVSARTFENQRAQLLLRCRALNLMTTLGMPDSYVVA